MAKNDGSESHLLLRKWIQVEAKKQISPVAGGGCNLEAVRNHRKKEFILRKTTIAYGIAELLRHAIREESRGPSSASLDKLCNIDNFAVRTHSDRSDELSSSAAATRQDQDGMQPTNNALFDIKGVDMLSPPRSVDIIEPSFLSSFHGDGCQGEGERWGRYLEVEFQPNSANDGKSSASKVSQSDHGSDEDKCFHLLGLLLYELFSHISHPREALHLHSDLNMAIEGREPSSKRIRLLDNESKAPSSSPKGAKIPTLVDMGLPSSIDVLVQDLLVEFERDGINRPKESYDSLDVVIQDLHLLLIDPNRFLFDRVPSSFAGKVQPSFRKNKLYGRESEVALMTDAFCRVSTGKSEAFFVGGYSGTGKTMLVNSLKASVDMADGYVLANKFDKMMSKGRPLSTVISIFNDLCLLIKEKRSQEDLQFLADKLRSEFGTDFHMLARLLPNIEVLSPQLQRGGGDRGHDQANLGSLCFLLKRFLLIVSSASHPVFLLMDDLQWCDAAAFLVLEGILVDKVGSSCLFFVGNYRSNEVHDDHAIFTFINSLKDFGVPTTIVNLDGLKKSDLNIMISDALCVFPRVCDPLSEMIFQKTKGNPQFVLHLVASLVDEGWLEYVSDKKRWVWDRSHIRTLDVSDNLLYLLSSKMSELSGDIQLALKVAACLGNQIKDSVVQYLADTSEYSSIKRGLDQAVIDGFMTKVGASGFRFAHDSLREAAYSLIDGREKTQFHCRIGISLYLMTKTKGVKDIIFVIADQINHGIKDVPAELRSDLRSLFEAAGTIAADSSDYASAHSYFSTALSLMPLDRWQCDYGSCLRLSLLMAKSAQCCGDVDAAQVTLHATLRECRCIQDKLPAYFLLATILYSCGEVVKSYEICQQVLSRELGEKIPLSISPEETRKIVVETSKAAKSVSDTYLLDKSEMHESFCIVLKFYGLMATVSFFAKPSLFAWIVCRSVRLTVERGVSKYSSLGLVQFAAMLVSGNKKVKPALIQDASRIGKAAISCWKNRYHAAPDSLPNPYDVYYSCIAFYTEPLQSCAECIRQGFDVGLTHGDSGTAFFNAIQHVSCLLWAGEKLSNILAVTDHYLELALLYKKELSKSYLTIFRDTLSTLIDKGESTNSNSKEPGAIIDAMKNESNLAALHFHKAIRAFWLGHSERCHHWLGKVPKGSPLTGRFSGIGIMFINGLNSFEVLKRHSTAKNKAIASDVIAMLKTASSQSTPSWNFRNKIHLLEARLQSLQGKDDEAKESYAAAISCARCSRFIHEQALACELAGDYYGKNGENDCAQGFFEQARQCYKEWGSQVKVDTVTRKLECCQVRANR